LSVEAKLNIWNAIVRPSIQYGSATWWTNKLQTAKLERIQLKALKVILGVSSKTSDIAVRLELGVMRLETRRKKTMLKWAGKISQMSSDRLVKHIFDNVDFSWHGKGRANRRTWKKRVRSILVEFGLVQEHSNITNLSETQWNKLVDKAAVQFELKVMRVGIDKSSKLALYNVREEILSLEFKDYLTRVMSPGKRLKFKLRSGTNALGEELRRWASRNETGNCKCCEQDCLEDTAHFVARCPRYAKHRKKFIHNLKHLLPADDVDGRSVINTFSSLNDNFSNSINGWQLKFLKFLLADHLDLSPEIAKKVYEEINSFLDEIYSYRNKCIFSPLNGNVGSAAYDTVTAKT